MFSSKSVILCRFCKIDGFLLSNAFSQCGIKAILKPQIFELLKHKLCIPGYVNPLLLGYGKRTYFFNNLVFPRQGSPMRPVYFFKSIKFAQEIFGLAVNICGDQRYLRKSARTIIFHGQSNLDIVVPFGVHADHFSLVRVKGIIAHFDRFFAHFLVIGKFQF